MVGALSQLRKLQATQPPDKLQKNHAMIYSDGDHAGEIVIHGKKLSLLRALRNQAVLAIKQSSLVQSTIKTSPPRHQEHQGAQRENSCFSW
jgi:hypothetical protein